MRYASVARVAIVGLALLLFVCISSVSWGAKPMITIKVTALKGTANVTGPGGTTVTLKDTSKPITLPATIEMVGPKGSFWISLPSAIRGKFNTVSWDMRQGETVRVSVLAGDRGVRVEYLKGTRKFFLDVNNQENVLLVRSVKGTTTFVILQNRVTVPEKAAALLTCPMNTFASFTVIPAQVSEIEFSYSPENKYIQVVEVRSQAGTVQVTRAGRTLTATAGAPAITQPIGIPPSERLAIPIPPPETIEESPHRPR